MNIIFDLDGTLICSKKRLHELFCYLVKHESLGFEEYWSLKFSGYTNQKILEAKFNYSQLQIESFVEQWMQLIETPQYLEMDKVIAGVPELLAALKENNNLFLCTARQSTEKAHEQLQTLGVKPFFERIFVTNQTSSKDVLLKNSGIIFGKDDWFVGDTGHDILTGRALGIKTCAVLSGFMSEEKLQRYSPNVILNDTTHLLRVI